MWESVILLLGYAMYIAFMTKNEKVADWIERRRLGGKRVTPGGSEMTRSVSQGPDFKAAIVKDTAMNPRLKPTYHPGHDEKLEQARAGERKKIAMGDAAVTALAVSRLSKTWLNKSRSGGLGGLVAQASLTCILTRTTLARTPTPTSLARTLTPTPLTLDLTLSRTPSQRSIGP